MRYNTFSIFLHWLLALVIFGTFCFGAYMVDLPFSPARLKQYNWHKWAGMTIFTISAIRLFWRIMHKPPELPAHMPAWQRFASHFNHWALYALFFIVPLLGWAYSNATGFPVVVYGWIALPDLVSSNESLAESLKLLHRYAAYSLAALVLIHIAAAFKHQWLDGDGLLSRMIPSLRSGRS